MSEGLRAWAERPLTESELRSRMGLDRRDEALANVLGLAALAAGPIILAVGGALWLFLRP